MNRGLSLLMISYLALWVGCIDSIDIALPEEIDGRLVIEGSVDRTKDKYIFSVFVTRTSAIDKSLERYTEPAKIHLLYQGETIMELTNSEAFSIPTHEFHASYGGQPQGAKFKIVVEAGGQQFESTEQQIIDAPAPGEFSTHLITREELNDREFILEREYVELRISTDLRNAAAERVSLFWEVQAYYQFREIIWSDTDFFFDPKICYVFEQDRSSEISLINALNTDKDRISNFKINEKLADYRFNSGHLYQVIQRTLNPNAAEYWEQVAQGIQREGTIFDDPPGRAISNIISTTDPGTEVLGYFYGAAVDTLFKLAKANETGYQPHLCSLNYLPFSPCCSCLDISGSSLDQPKNWIE